MPQVRGGGIGIKMTRKWQVKLAKGILEKDEVFVYADEAKVTKSGDLVFLIKNWGAATIVFAVSNGNWIGFQVVSVDGEDVEVRSW